MMEKLVIFYSILALAFLCNGTSAQLTPSFLTSVIGRYSSSCQSTFTSTISPYAFNAKFYCSSNGLTLLNKKLVVWGFCKHNEFSNFTESVCTTTTLDQSDSETKMMFIAAMNDVSSSCQTRVLTCIRSSAVPTILKTQEQHCPLMELKLTTLSLEDCVKSGKLCSADEFQRMRDGACASNDTNVDQTFSNALLNTSLDCQTGLDHCSEDSYTQIMNDEYCDLMNSSVSFKTCLSSDGRCKESEFIMLNDWACREPTSFATSHTTTTVTVMTSTKSPENNTILTSVTSTDSPPSTPPVNVQDTTILTVVTSTDSPPSTPPVNVQGIKY